MTGTEQTTERVCKQLHDILPEFTDSYLIIGETLDKEPIARFWAPTQEAADRINALLRAVAAAGGVKFEEQVEVEATV